MSQARFYKEYINVSANQVNRTAHRYKRLASFATYSIAQHDKLKVENKSLQRDEVQLKLAKDVSLATEGQ